jgi:arylsulfatase A-like enzyme
MVHHSGSGKFALRQGDWVLIGAPTGDDNGGPQRNGEPAWLKQARGYIANPQPGELFNVRDDLSQCRNQYAEQPALVQRFKALLEQHRSQGRSRPGSIP